MAVYQNTGKAATKANKEGRVTSGTAFGPTSKQMKRNNALRVAQLDLAQLSKLDSDEMIEIMFRDAMHLDLPPEDIQRQARLIDRIIAEKAREDEQRDVDELTI